MGFIQEFKAEKSIEALQKMASLKAVVFRNGKEMRIDAALLVPGDVIILETGEKIPADARILEASNLKTQEGALTGESLPDGILFWGSSGVSENLLWFGIPKEGEISKTS